MNVRPCDRSDAELDQRVGLTGLGIGRRLDPLAGRHFIQDRELTHGGIVKMKEGDARGVGAPPVRTMIAVENLLEVDPVGLAVGDEVAAVGRQHPLGLRGHIDDEQVAVPHEGDELAVGTEGDQLLAAG